MREITLEDMRKSAGLDGIQADEVAVLTTSVKPKIDKLGRSYATGRRKTAVAKVWLRIGSGKFVVNGKAVDAYFVSERLQNIVGLPFRIVNRDSGYDVVATVLGGGIAAQASALRHGISVALVNLQPEYRPSIKSAALLTRDSRKVERKKFGHKKARKSFQFSKR